MRLFSIIVSFPKPDDGNRMKSMLVRNGYEVTAVCTSGAQTISMANELDAGIVICGYRLTDMLYREINGYLPRGFEMLLVAGSNRLAEFNDINIVSLAMPVKVHELVDTIELMTYRYNKNKKREEALKKKDTPQIKKRSVTDKALIDEAKILLMERNHLTESEAYRYIQKASMDSCTNMLEMAQMILLSLKKA